MDSASTLKAARKRKDRSCDLSVKKDLHKAIQNDSLQDVIQLMDTHDIDPNIVYDHLKYEPSLLMLAAQWCTTGRIVEELLERGAFARSMSVHGWTPLHFATRHGSLSAVKLIASASGPSMVDHTNPKGSTPLMMCCMRNDDDDVSAVSIAEYLLDELGVNIHKKNNVGYTPLLAACQHQPSMKLVSCLVSRGANILDVTEKDGFNCLMVVMGNKKMTIDDTVIRSLVDFGADPYHKDTAGFTALEHAVSYGGGAHVKMIAPFYEGNRVRPTPIDFNDRNPDPVGSFREYCRAFPGYGDSLRKCSLAYHKDHPRGVWACLRINPSHCRTELYDFMRTCSDPEVWRVVIGEIGTDPHPGTGETLWHVAARSHNEAALDLLMRAQLNPLLRDVYNRRVADLPEVCPRTYAAMTEYATFKPTRIHARWYGPYFVERAFTFLCVSQRWHFESWGADAVRTAAHLVLRELAALEYI